MIITEKISKMLKVEWCWKK